MNENIRKLEIQCGTHDTAANTAVYEAPYRGWLHKMHFEQKALQVAICTAICNECNRYVLSFFDLENENNCKRPS
jgi:hypothetical protein